VFVSWVAQQTGATSYRSSYVSGWVTKARNGAYGLSVTTSPVPGDIVAFDWNGGANFNDGNEHIGIVRAPGAHQDHTSSRPAALKVVGSEWPTSRLTPLPLGSE